MHAHVPFSAFALSVLATLGSARDIAPRWKPAQQTGLPKDGDNSGAVVDDIGVSPVPTEVPRQPSELANMELFKRFQMGTDTCGFAAEFKSSPWTCFRVGAKCTTTGSHMGCCVDDFPACQASFLTTCLDLSTAPSSCGTGSLCCSSTASPSCFTWRFSSSTNPSVTYSLLNCYASGGIGTLLDAPPALSTTSTASKTTTTSSSTSSSSSSSTSSTSSTSSPKPTQTDSPSPVPVGPIVGGVLGGVAIIGIAVVTIFYLIYRHRRQNGATVSSTTTPGAGGVAPGGALAPGGGGMYYAPGASPTSPASLGQLHYDPSKETHGGQQTYSASGQPGWMPSPVPTEQGAYGHQQGWTAQGQVPLQHQPPPISELGAAHYPLGTQAHRAELEH